MNQDFGFNNWGNSKSKSFNSNNTNSWSDGSDSDFRYHADSPEVTAKPAGKGKGDYRSKLMDDTNEDIYDFDVSQDADNSPVYKPTATKKTVGKQYKSSEPAFRRSSVEERTKEILEKNRQSVAATNIEDIEDDKIDVDAYNKLLEGIDFTDKKEDENNDSNQEESYGIDTKGPLKTKSSKAIYNKWGEV